MSTSRNGFRGLHQEDETLGLRFDPVGGGQFKQAVKAIIEAESQPIKLLEVRKGKENARLKLFGEFKNKFSTLQKSIDEISTFKRLRELKAELGDGQSQVDVTIDKDKATPGTYQMSVQSLAERTSVISNSFSSPDEPVMGMGFITLDTPDGTREVYVEEDKSSLRGIANLINEQKDFPVRAAVVKDAADKDKPWKLIMTAKKDGQANQVEFPDFYFLDGKEDFYLDDTRDAQNAQVNMDGFDIELESNDVQDFLPGVNLHLKQAKPDTPFTLTIAEDFKKISGKMKNVVDGVNGVLKFINDQNRVDKDSDTSTTFAGDSGLQNIEYRLRNMMHEGFGVGDPEDKDHFKVYYMSDLGIEFDKEGSLTFKQDKFQKFMENDFESLSEIFTGPMGFAYQMGTLLSGYSEMGTGMLAQRENAIRTRIKGIDDEIDMKQRNIERRQQSLTEQYSRLEASLGDMQRQQQYLAASLPGAGGGGNLVQQLLG
jgi:flagellar hook-associated protein 2